MVVLEVSVDEYGSPVIVGVFSSSGHSILDKAALKAAQKWRFQLGTIDGILQNMTVRVPVRFTLND